VAWWRHYAPSLVVYRSPDERVSFGDIFESDYLIDIHVDSNTSALGGGPMDRRVAERIAKQNNLSLTDDESERILVYTPAMQQHRDRFDVLGRGTTMKLTTPNRGILLTDSCAVDTALVVDRDGRRKRGRLLFAPVVPARDDDVDRLTEKPVWGRFPLPRADSFDGGAVAELRYCFMVDVRDVCAEHRILALDEEAADELEVAWNAYALRRGPLATERNAVKLEASLPGTSDDPSHADGPTEMIEEALNVAWRLEGTLSEAAETAEFDIDKLNHLAADLKELEEAARIAHERLSNVRPA
jgi:hypothetical protein